MTRQESKQREIEDRSSFTRSFERLKRVLRQRSDEYFMSAIDYTRHTGEEREDGKQLRDIIAIVQAFGTSDVHGSLEYTGGNRTIHARKLAGVTCVSPKQLREVFRAIHGKPYAYHGLNKPIPKMPRRKSRKVEIEDNSPFGRSFEALKKVLRQRPDEYFMSAIDSTRHAEENDEKSQGMASIVQAFGTPDVHRSLEHAGEDRTIHVRKLAGVTCVSPKQVRAVLRAIHGEPYSDHK